MSGPWIPPWKKWESSPAFKKDGTVTAGNASGINDAAAALLVMSGRRQRNGIKTFRRIRAFSSAGVDPAYMGLGPVPAVRKILAKENLTIDDFGTIELNEAFASQAIACAGNFNATWKKPIFTEAAYRSVIPSDAQAPASS